MIWHHLKTAILVCLCLPASAPGAAAAQQSTAVEGRVFEVGGATPVPGARVSLVPIIDSIPIEKDETATLTDEDGRYRFEALAIGRYRMTIARIGFKPIAIDLNLRREAPLRVAVGMVLQPVELERVEVTAAESSAPAVAAEQERQRRSSRRDLISREEIEERGLASTNVYEIVRRLRPGWISNRGVTSIREPDVSVMVYVDNVRYGPVDVLHNMSMASIEEIWFIDSIQATQRWGSGHTLGVIHIIRRP